MRFFTKFTCQLHDSRKICQSARFYNLIFCHQIIANLPYSVTKIAVFLKNVRNLGFLKKDGFLKKNAIFKTGKDGKFAVEYV